MELSEEKLLNLGLLRKEGNVLHQTRGMHILAGAYDHVRIQCARFKGDTMAVFLDKKECSGNLFDQLAMSELFIQNHLRVISEIKGLQRVDRWEIPQPAIREALVNAVVHRDYANPGRTIKVAIYDDILEIVFPGSLPNTLTLEQLKLGGRSEIRNRVLAGVFKRLNYIEQWGSGIERMNALCQDAGLTPPVLTESGEFLAVVITRPNISVAATDNTTDKWSDTTDNEQKILEYLQAHKSISNQQARELTGLTSDGVLYLLKTLTKNGRIIPAGANRNRVYRPA
ncbi:hypothetical protein SDC9_153666 [bioreactor metagenome]|uniref:Uncharacterized protein n=1 Tax=bioreactor metagenome TaxID=1076179 RepID=A0A645EY61_9ZZZZ